MLCMVNAVLTSRQTENPEPSSRRETTQSSTFLVQRNQNLELSSPCNPEPASYLATHNLLSLSRSVVDVVVVGPAGAAVMAAVVVAKVAAVGRDRIRAIIYDLRSELPRS